MPPSGGIGNGRFGLHKPVVRKIYGGMDKQRPELLFCPGPRKGLARLPGFARGKPGDPSLSLDGRTRYDHITRTCSGMAEGHSAQTYRGRDS
jgi:hypothetical protein